MSLAERMRLKRYLCRHLHDVNAIEILIRQHPELRYRFATVTHPMKLNGKDYADYHLHKDFNGGSISFTYGKWYLWYYEPPSFEEVGEGLKTRQFVKHMFNGDSEDLDLFVAEPQAVEESITC